MNLIERATSGNEKRKLKDDDQRDGNVQSAEKRVVKDVAIEGTEPRQRCRPRQ